jgi:hypothetical protein
VSTVSNEIIGFETTISQKVIRCKKSIYDGVDNKVRKKDKKLSLKGAVKVAVKGNFGAVKVSGGAVILAKSSREGLAGPGNPGRSLSRWGSIKMIWLCNPVFYD